jgi:hypothetical protein
MAKKAEKLPPLVACVVVEVHREYESETHKEIRRYGWSAGVSPKTLPFPLACIQGQSRHGDPKDALDNALEFLGRLGIEVVSKCIPRVL